MYRAVFYLLIIIYTIFAGSIAQGAQQSPKIVYAGIKVTQITEVNQKAENFSAVVEYALSWQEDIFAYAPENNNGSRYKNYTLAELHNLLREQKLLEPQMTFYNQQGRIDTQKTTAIIEPSGKITIYRKFTGTFQAPEFDFSKYPFDDQTLYIHLDSLLPLDSIVISPLTHFSGLGDKLGEEAWILTTDGPITSEQLSSFGQTISRLSLPINMKRHLTYYVFKIFIPLGIIILVSWFTFFLEDYVKRIDISAGNLLLFVAYNFSVSSDLPHLGYITFLESIMLITFLLSGMTVLINVIFKNLQRRGKMKRLAYLDILSVWAYPLLYIIGIIGSHFYFFN